MRGERPLYAHNDYTNRHPLTDALAARVRGVEADVFLIDGVLRVGHDRRAARRGRRLDSLYLLPLAERIAQCGALTADGRPFLLTIEQKERSRTTYDSLTALLARVPMRLARDTGTSPVLVVLVGWVPPINDSNVARPARHVALRDEPDPAQTPRSGDDALLSLDYGKTIGRSRIRGGGARWWGVLEAWRAAYPQRLLRVHNVPPHSATYAALLRAGVDLIGTKSLAASVSILEALAGPSPVDTVARDGPHAMSSATDGVRGQRP